MQILIPLVGRQNTPAEVFMNKNFKTVGDKYTLEHIFDFFVDSKPDNFLTILKKQDIELYQIDNFIKMIIPKVKMIVAEKQTKGAACSCLLAVDQLDLDDELIIAGPDKMYGESISKALNHFRDNDLDCGLIVFDDINPKYSYAKIDSMGFVVEVAEKNPISRNAIVGIYYYKKAQYFIDSVQDMIIKKSAANNQFYVAPSVNQMILHNKKVGSYKISRDIYFDLNDEDYVEKFLTYKGYKNV